jgi:hypothetical protein
VVNQSFVTSQLQARLVADIPTDISLDFHPEPLEGKPEEMRSLGIKLSQPGFTDLTVSFYARGDKTELGGRDRVHLLMRCFNEASHPVGRPHSEG